MMGRRSRREFLRAGVAAAVTAAAIEPAASREPSRYAKAVTGEDDLLALWPLDGALDDRVGGQAGRWAGKGADFVSGPMAGSQAAALRCGAFVVVGPVPALETPETTVELFFQLLEPATSSYNPCLAAMRATSAETRFSVHYAGNLSAVMVWNGISVSSMSLPRGPLRPGAWHHLAVASGGAQGLQGWLDGVPLAVGGPAPFAASRKGLPLVLGASDPGGSEAASVAMAWVAVYGKALTGKNIAAHVAAAGWGARMKRMAREDERRRKQERQDRDRKTAARLKARRLTEVGEPRVYEAAALQAIRLGLGGIGAGSIQLAGTGERAIWQIFNNFEASAVPLSFLAVTARATGAEPVTRALQATAAGRLAGMAEVKMVGEYPLARHVFADPALPLQVSVESYSPLIPMNEKDSSIPCAVFEVTVANPGRAAVSGEVLAVQQNAVGCTGRAAIQGRHHPGYGGNRNRGVAAGDLACVHMTAEGKAGPHAGDMALAALAQGARVYADWRPGVEPTSDAGPTAPGETVDAAVSVPLEVPPGASRTITFVLAWHFPNAVHGTQGGWRREGNRYAGWWPDAMAVARYVASEHARLASETRLYHDTVYRSNLPRWLLDRCTSQVAVLRSQTCFWAGDGYFGAWEGCNPEGGCCEGNCTHVWHYAQAHARLFPGIGRRMREQTYGFQHADGSLPHRHPAQHAATDGQCGDILGVWREHLCSTDGAWLAAMWPKAKRAMEATIARWDADEDGVLAGPQWNTLDGELGGSTTWLGSLYLSALAACERMAELQEDPGAAQRYRRIRASGARRQNQSLWNGEYYIQLRDETPRQDYADGCHVDQLLGEWWAAQVGLPMHYPAERAVSALRALVRYNFRPDFRGVPQQPRKFVHDDDPGTQMIQWPEGKPRPVPCMMYADEAMTGFEYAAAATMVQRGLLREGLMLALAVSDRYDGRLKGGLTEGNFCAWGYSGNPFGDDECGKYYARAMSSWSLLLACQGFEYDGPAGVIGFRPVWRPADHASFFTGAEGWGLYTQRRTSGRLRARIQVAYGRLRLCEVRLALPAAARVTVRAAGQVVAAGLTVADGVSRVRLADAVTLQAPEAMEIILQAG